MKRFMKRSMLRSWTRVIIVLCIGWILFEGRFWIPRRIRPPKNVRPVSIELKTTSYCHCGRCCSYKWLFGFPYQRTGPFSFRLKHVGKTSSGAMARPGTIAADTTIYPYGTIMKVPGYGYGRVEDRGGAVKGQHIDLYRSNHWLSRRWGVRSRKVKVWFPPQTDATETE
jgi:3D (Asp-Asp-Asp) domain-containing protein